MTNGTGGGFPSGDDEPAEGGPRDAGTSGEPDTHTNTEGIEILDDGADWLATQLAALPADTTDIPVVSDSGAREAEADGDGAQADGDAATSLDDASETRRFPVLPEAYAPTPSPARSEEAQPPAADAPAAPEPAVTESEPPLTRPRVPEIVAGWFAPSPPRPPLPTATPPEPDPDASDPETRSLEPSEPATSEPVTSEPVTSEPATSEPATSEVPTPETPEPSERPDADEPDESFASPRPAATGPDAAPSAAGLAHPNAIVLPGLPSRGAPAGDSDAAPAGETEREATDRRAIPSEESPASADAVAPEDTGDIDFGSFAWSLVPNEEDDPHLRRERAEAEERAAAGTTGEAPAAGAGGAVDDQTEVPSWSRPDRDDAFPATAAMGALPADEDPDDPDDELDAADRLSALGTAAMPVSAASAAAGETEHAAVPSVAERPGSRESVFPDGLVAEPVGPVPERPRGRSGDDARQAGGQRPTRFESRDGRRVVPLVAAAVVIVLALAGLFYLGTRLPLIFAGSAGAAESATPTPSVTTEAPADQPASGPLAAGTYAWDELRGGECLEPFSSPWDEEFTVVDCAQPHAGQLVFTAPYADDPATPFPGEDVIASEIGLLCSAPGVVDFGAAAPFTDLQVQGAYPVSGEQWAAGDRDYFCFVSRSSGEPLAASVATAP
jgi:hypothetical protein